MLKKEFSHVAQPSTSMSCDPYSPAPTCPLLHNPLSRLGPGSPSHIIPRPLQDCTAHCYSKGSSTL